MATTGSPPRTNAAQDETGAGQEYEYATSSMSFARLFQPLGAHRRKPRLNDYIIAGAMGVTFVLAVLGVIDVVNAFTRIFP